MLHPLNVCKILAPVDLTAPKVAAGKKNSVRGNLDKLVTALANLSSERSTSSSKSKTLLLNDPTSPSALERFLSFISSFVVTSKSCSVQLSN